MNKCYQFRAKNAFNRKVKSTIIAKNKSDAFEKIYQQEYDNIKISRQFQTFSKIKENEINIFLNYFASLLAVKIPLKNTITILKNQQKNIKLFNWIENIETDLHSGFSLSQSLKNNQLFITYQEILMIEIAEKSGNLDLVLQKIAKNRDNQTALRKKIKKILFYPVFILVISLTLSLLLLLFIVPVFSDIYQDPSKLPLITKSLILIANIIHNHWIVLCLITIMGVFFIKYLYQQTTMFKRILMKVISIIPNIKNIIVTNRSVFFCEYLSLMLNSKVSFTNAIATFLNKDDFDKDFQIQINIILESLERGISFSKSIDETILGYDLITIAEIADQTNSHATMLKQYATEKSEKLHYQIDLLSQILEPLLMVIIGSLIGFILIGLYMPIFNLGSNF